MDKFMFGFLAGAAITAIVIWLLVPVDDEDHIDSGGEW